MYETSEKRSISLMYAILAGVLIAAAAFGGGFLIGGKKAGTPAAVALSLNAGPPPGVDFSPVWKAWAVINEKFVPVSVASSTPVVASSTSSSKDTEKRVWGMISGLAASLDDPYTFFLPPSENEQFASDMSGSFEGVGMEVAVKDKVLTVVSPLKGTPAERAGMKSGDLIIKIDGISTEGMDVTQAVKKIRGPKGTVVTFVVLREVWSESREIKVTREVINVPVVTTTARPDGVYVIEVATFTSSSQDLFRGALRKFVESGDTKLILDLRGNPGGYLGAAVDMASWFLPLGKIVVTEDYAGHAVNVVHRSLGYNIFNSNLKMVILVDRGSASASEILADALHDHGIAKLVGTNTFGKGSVQELVEITPGTALKITVARWLAPDGVHIPQEGITPDFEVKITEEEVKAGKDPQMDKAVELLKGM
ncbi:S41 family peptidase [Candidatus Kaiserbacteria bacterium]|nr:S41 family peptidase [Candidatus Kaiserbacteria bacterium]